MHSNNSYIWLQFETSSGYYNYASLIPTRNCCPVFKFSRATIQRNHQNSGVAYNALSDPLTILRSRFGSTLWKQLYDFYRFRAYCWLFAAEINQDGFTQWTCISQLYGSTKVVMATITLKMAKFTLKMAKFDPLPKTSEWTDWKNIWHDWLRHRPKQSSIIWFRKNFPGRRYTYSTYKGSSFFFFFHFIFF